MIKSPFQYLIVKRRLISSFLLLAALGVASAEDLSSGTTAPAVVFSSPVPAASTAAVEISSNPATLAPSVHAIHLTASAAGSKKYRQKLDKMFQETILNAVVVDLKDEGGEVYVPGVNAVERAGAYRREIPDLASWISDLKKRHIYTVGRIVVFKDNILPRKTPSLGVHNNNGDLWFDRKHGTWLDPYNRDAWRYILLIALEASKLGFDEIQFDYLRFPTDGPLLQTRFSKPYSRNAASQALVDFLAQARQLLHPMGAKISIDVFGLTTSVNTGMGIGQLIVPMAEQVDFVCPMTYPSHYARGEYGIANPNDQPYRTVSLAMHGALKTLGPQGREKLRPYLQDFSLKGRGIPYRSKEVRAQIQAAADAGVANWTLWNAICHYTLDAIRSPVNPAISSSTVKSSK